MAKRIQLKRTKGWRKPEGCVVVARPTAFGNYFTIKDYREAGYQGSDEDARAFVVQCYERWLNGDRSAWQGVESDARAQYVLDRLDELRGKDLACWCPLDGPCHADVLLRLANAAPPEESGK